MIRSLLVLFPCLLLAVIAPAQTGAPKESPTQSVRGRVVDAKTGQPIRKVNVDLMGAGEQQSFARHSAITASDGSFTFTDIQPGKYIVTLQHPGFIQATARSPVFFSLAPGQSLTGLLFQMQAAGIISGKITDRDGDPMAGVGVSVETIGASQNPAVTMGGSPGFGQTNDLGEYRIASLRPGKYLVVARPSQPPPAAHSGDRGPQKDYLIYGATYYPGTLDKNRAIPVVVQSSEEATANFGPLTTHAYRVTGTVSGVPSAAISQLVLYSTSGGDTTDGPQQLGEGGRFEVQNLLPGTYTAMMMVVKGLLSGEHQMQILRLAPSIDVDNANVDGVQLHVEPGGQLRGKFHLDTEDKFDWTQLNVNLLPIPDDKSAAPSGIMVATTETFLSQANTNSAVSTDGTFELKNVPSGNYQLLIGARSVNLRDYYTKSVSLAGRDVADSGFAMNDDVYLDVLISAKGATIDGNVVDSKGQPAPYATVVVVPDSDQRARPDSYQQSTADEHGHFSVPGLNPASYLVLAFEELQWDTWDTRSPEFSKTHRDKAEKVELKEGTRVTVTTKIGPAETQTP